MKKLITFLLLIVAVAAVAQDNIWVDITAQTNQNAFVRRVFRTYETAFDTSGMAWLNPAATDWGDSIDTGITAATLGDSTIMVTWTAGTGQHHYRLEYNLNTGAGFQGWALVDSTIPAGSTSYTWDGDPSVVPPRSGEINLRLYGANAAEDTLSAVALLDSLFYNNAVRVVARFDAIEDTLADFSNIVSSSLDSALWVSQPD